MANSIGRGVRIYEGNKTIRCEVTPWFPPSVKPVRKGDYIIGSDELHVMNHWDGEFWRRYDGSLALDQNLCWAGWTGRYL